MDFSEGLRVIGIKPDEKIALFAENSCRWLVADQGVHIFISNIVVWMIKVFLLLFFLSPTLYSVMFIVLFLQS